MKQRYVETPAELALLCADLAGADFLALDTEFLRERTYYPKLCLIQVCGNGVAACVDPLAVGDLGPFLALLQEPSRVKVWHAARQDLEIMLHDWDVLPAPVFDTQPAAAVLGYGDQMGYARLVQEVLGVELPKDQSRSDWCRRPLEPTQLRYAYDDVIYLAELYRKLSPRLDALNRRHWLDEDFAELLRPETYRTEPTEAWLRIRGRQHLKGVRLAVLQQLAAWREKRAVAVDRPRRWILKDEVLVDVARRRPETLDDLARIRGLDTGAASSLGEAILDCVRHALAMPREDWPRERIPPSLTPQQEATVDVLAGVVRLVGEANTVTPATLATRGDLAKLVSGQDSALDHGWRRLLVGDLLREVVAGERVLRVREGNMELVTWSG